MGFARSLILGSSKNAGMTTAGPRVNPLAATPLAGHKNGENEQHRADDEHNEG